MKKSIVLIMAGVMAFSMTGCSGGDSSADQNETSAVTEITVQNLADTPLDILNTVWDSYSESEKFPAAGGDFSEENNNMEGPGVYGTEDAEGIESLFGLPAASVSKIESAASLMHMMNANTFTCAAFRVKDGEDVSAIVSEIKDTLTVRDWLCGFPDKLVIITGGSDVIAFFGKNEPVDTFRDKILESFSDAEIAIEENLIV